MARINIEDSLFKDGRFTELAIALGDRFKAIGCLVCLWGLGQEYWKKDKSLIPVEKWESQRLPNELIKCGFVEQKAHGYYVKGAEKHFKWLINKQEIGRKGGLAKKKSTDNKNNNLGESAAKQELGLPKPPTPTPTPTPTHSLKENIIIAEPKKSSPKKQAKPKTAETWKAYANAYSERYGTAPVRNAKVNGQLSQLVKRLGETEAPLVADFFLGCSDDWLVRKFHPLGILVQDCETYRTRWKARVVKVGNRKYPMFSKKNQELAEYIAQMDDDDKGGPLAFLE